MKSLAFILSFLIIGLSAWPCADDYMMDESSKMAAAITAPNDQQHDHEDACSPFCHCTCCAGFSINHSSITATSMIPCNTLLYSSYLPGSLIEHSSAVWQPPRTG